MTLLERLLAHDAWTTRALLDCCDRVGDAELDREFSLGPGTIRRTFAHIVRNMEVWTDLMRGDEPRLPPMESSPSVGSLKHRLDEIAPLFAETARDVEHRKAWEETWLDTVAEPHRVRSLGGTIGHLITHSMHHRAQLIWMLKQVGVADVPEGDLLSWERQARESSR